MRTRVLILSVLALAACSPKPQAEAQTPQAMPAAAAAADATTAAAPTGSYECWANGEARMLMNFTVTAPGAYTASDNSTGTFTIAGDGTATFTGYEGEIMPEGFTINYHLAQGRPTFSFMGTGGAEAAFCEHTG